MDTQTPIRGLHDIVTIKNITDEDFVFEYDRSRGNYPYTIKAGAIARFPRFLAEHAMKHLIDKILIGDKKRVDNEAAREDAQSRIFIGEEVFQQKPENADAEILRKQVEQLNQPSDLDKVLARAKTVAPTAKPEPIVAETQSDTQTPVVETQISYAKPTRLEVLRYAENKMGMVLNKETMEKLDKLTDDELIAELQYPMEQK